MTQSPDIRVLTEANAGAHASNPATPLGAALAARIQAEVPPLVPPLVADAIANDPTVAQSAATMAQNSAGLLPVWQANTSYAAGQRVVAPNGDVVSAKVAFTSGAAYSATNWNASTQDGRIVALESIKAFRGLVPNNSDVSTWKTSAYNGWWLINGGTQAGTITGLPGDVPAPKLGWLFHNASDNGMFLQEFRTYGTAAGIYINENTTFNSSTWRGWRKLRTSADTAGVILGNVHLSTVAMAPNTYYPGAGSSVTVENGYPANAVGLVGPLEVLNWTSSTTRADRIWRYSPWNTTKFFVKHVYDGVPEANWAEYEDSAILRAYVDEKVSGVQGSGPDAGIHQRTMRLNNLRHRYAPVSTGGKGAVALVMDHGTNKMREIVPLLAARGLTATLALNSDMYNPSDNRYLTNNQTTWAEIQGWNVEKAAHGRTHSAQTGYAAILNEIQGCRTELEASMPGEIIDSWVQPGSGSNDGFNDGQTLDAYWETDAGRIILDTYPVVTGQLPGTRLLPLIGEPTIGMMGSWIDTGQASIDAVKNVIISAGAQRRGFLVRFHPEMLDQAGKTSTAELTAFLDWLAAKNDIMVLPLRQLAIATL